MDCLPTNGHLVTISKVVYIPVAVLCAFVIVVMSLLIAINIRFRQYKLLKMTSPNLNIVTLIGSIFLTTSILLNGAQAFLSENPTKKSTVVVWRVTQSSLWFLCVGFTLFFAPIAAKTWRVHKIFTDAAVKGRVIKDDRLLCIVAAFVIFDFILMGLWFILDTPTCKFVPFSQTPGFLTANHQNEVMLSLATLVPEATTPEVSLVNHTTICLSVYTPVWAVVMATYKASMIFYVIYVSWATRFVTFPSMKDSGGIIISCFVTLTLFCSGLPLVVTLNRWPSVQFAIYSAIILISTITFLSFHYVPKFSLLKKNKDEGISRGFSQYTTPQKKEFSDEEIRDLVVQNTSLRKELQEKQRKYKVILEQNRVAKAKLLKFTFSKETTLIDGGDVFPKGDVGDDNNIKAPKAGDEVSKFQATSVENSTLENNLELQVVLDDKTVTKTKDLKTDDTINSNKKSKHCVKDQDEECKNRSSSCNDAITQTGTNENNPPSKSTTHTSNHVSSNQTLPRRAVSFHPQDQDKKDNETLNTTDKTYTDQSSLHTNNQSPQKNFTPSLGKKGWDYYIHGTGYLRYKENVLHHNNGDVLNTVHECRKLVQDPNRIVARKSEAYTDSGISGGTSISSNYQQKVPSKPSKLSLSNTKPQTTWQTRVKGRYAFRYYSTSAGSHSPSVSISTDGASPDRVNREKLQDSDDDDLSSMEAGSATSSLPRSKTKRPSSGKNNVKVTTSATPDSMHHLDFDFTSGSDSDEYGSTSSMDSITCELFPPLSYRHRHYLRHYDVMHAKYIAHRERQRKRQKKNAIYYLERSEGYSSDAAIGDEETKTNSNNVKTARHRQDGRFVYDSITSSDTESEGSLDDHWCNVHNKHEGSSSLDPHTLHKCWHKVAQQQKQHNEAFLSNKPMPLTTTTTKGILV